MKYTSVFLLLVISSYSNAGSLGKYQQGVADVPVTIAPIGQPIQPSAISRSPVAVVDPAQQIERSYYNAFNQRVLQLTTEDRQSWLVKYKNSLQSALGESPIDVSKINHYSRLVSILQSKGEG